MTLPAPRPLGGGPLFIFPAGPVMVALVCPPRGARRERAPCWPPHSVPDDVSCVRFHQGPRTNERAERVTMEGISSSSRGGWRVQSMRGELTSCRPPEEAAVPLRPASVSHGLQVIGRGSGPYGGAHALRPACWRKCQSHLENAFTNIWAPWPHPADTKLSTTAPSPSKAPPGRLYPFTYRGEHRGLQGPGEARVPWPLEPSAAVTQSPGSPSVPAALLPPLGL